MKKITVFAFLLFSFMVSFAQSDIITKHTGEVIKGKVIKVDEFIITYKYEGEDAEISIRKYAIEKIVYGKTNRIEKVSEKIIISSADDWEKVVMLEDKSYIAGLTRVDEIKGKTALINFQTGNTGDKKADKKLKMAAAALGCPFIFMTSDKTTVGSSSNQMGGSQAIKKGIAYKY
jgi:hypothetical protein